MMENTALNEGLQREFSAAAYQSIRNFLQLETGIDLGPSKQHLVSSRLNKRLRHCSINNFDDYARFLSDSNNQIERQMAIDLLSTNETYFFRESEHFEILKKRVLEKHPKNRLFRLWSAASSSGEEAYSIAMVLDDFFSGGSQWEVFGSDISSRIVTRATRGLYPMHRIDTIPANYLKRYCLKGVGKYQGFLLVDEKLRKRTRFSEVNLIKQLPEFDLFDVIFLRNVLIYFDNPTKDKIIRGLLPTLRPGGLLFIGHSESLKDLDLPLELIAPSTYQKSERKDGLELL